MGRRLSAGGLIDRIAPLEFTFDGRTLSGFEGDTLASALLANDVHLIGRSFKYHRPRGVTGLREDDATTVVDLGAAPFEEPNAHATVTRLCAGLEARSVHCWPSVGFDIGALYGLAKPFLPAGFYYKTFMWPGWRWFEPWIRRSAGLGNAPEVPDPDRYEHVSSHCDVLICGGGPAGLHLAEALAGTGLRIVLAEQDTRLGGTLLTQKSAVGGKPGHEWAEALATRLQERANVVLMRNATAFGVYEGNWVGVHERCETNGEPALGGRLHHIVARRIVLATGAHERPLIFPNNDRPGVMQASAVAGYVHRYGVAPGERIAFATNNPTAFQAAFDVQDAGLEIAGLIDFGPDTEPALIEDCGERNIPLFRNSVVTDVIGRKRVSGIELRTEAGRGDARRLACDCVAVSGGHSPVVHLAAQGAVAPVWDAALRCFRPGEMAAGMRSAGAVNGHFDLAGAFADAGRVAASLRKELAGATDAGVTTEVPATDQQGVMYGIGGPWMPEEGGPEGRCWVDLLHDVTVRDIRVAAQENFTSVEHFKRYTTVGMAPDQGKTSGVNGLAVLAGLTGRAIPEVGTTRYRPPYTPMPLAALAGPARGPLYRPLRRLALHDWHRAHGGAMEEYGGWLRPACYRPGGQSERDAIDAEVRNVRANVGILDYSPLGKIDVIGPDAARFLDRIYMNDVSGLKIGRARYGLVLNEDGSIRDDGVFGRLGETHFMLTTTSGGAAAMAAWLERWHACDWPEMDVVFQPFTGHWGTISIAGPNARDVIQRLDSDIDSSAGGFANMSVTTGRLEGIEARVMRVSFSGELTYEVSAPVAAMDVLWRRLVAAGADLGIAPFGIEALMVMRTEKGFLHVGADTDSTTLPGDMGFARLGAGKTVHFLGRRSLISKKARNPCREQLVGLQAVDGTTMLHTGGMILAGKRAKGATRTQGRVTSGYYSPTLNRPVALGVVEAGAERHGETVEIYQQGETVGARIGPVCGYDPEGARMNV